jgi:hypothetical protein
MALEMGEIELVPKKPEWVIKTTTMKQRPPWNE